MVTATNNVHNWQTEPFLCVSICEILGLTKYVRPDWFTLLLTEEVCRMYLSLQAFISKTCETTILYTFVL